MIPAIETVLQKNLVSQILNLCRIGKNIQSFFKTSLLVLVVELCIKDRKRLFILKQGQRKSWITQIKFLLQKY